MQGGKARVFSREALDDVKYPAMAGVQSFPFSSRSVKTPNCEKN